MIVTIKTDKEEMSHSGIKEIKTVSFGEIPFLALVYESGYSKKMYKISIIREIFTGKNKEGK